MEVIENWGEGPVALGRRRCAFTIGAFDGLHLGHRAVMAALARAAGRLRAASLVLTFEPHPLSVLAPAAAPPLLTTLAQKAEVLAGWGVDVLGVLRFNRDMATLEPVKFLNQYLGKWVEPAGAVLGPDFSFGRGGAGDSATLAAWLAQASPRAKVEVVAPAAGADGQYSSSQVRQDLKSGLVAIAAQALGRPYRLAGTVAHGQARGRLMGFPTANLGDITQLVPGPGVYATRAVLAAGTFPSMTSIGYNPTFGERPMTVETHILDFGDFIYGQPMAVDFAAKLREMAKFRSAEELAAQLRADAGAARKALWEKSGDR